MPHESTIDRRAVLAGGVAVPIAGLSAIGAAEPLAPEDAYLLELERRLHAAKAEWDRFTAETFNPAEHAYIAAGGFRGTASAEAKARWRAVERCEEMFGARAHRLECAIAEAPAASLTGLCVKARLVIQNKALFSGSFLDNTAASLAEHVLALAGRPS